MRTRRAWRNDAEPPGRAARPLSCVLSRARSLRLRTLPASLSSTEHRTPATSHVPPNPLRWALAVGVAVAAVSLPLALAARRPDVAGRMPAVKRPELERGAAAPGRVAKPRVVRAVRGPGWRRGIVASGLAPFSESAYRIVNQWQDVVGGEHVNVYAGQLGLSPRRGAVVVQRTPVTGAS